MNEEGEAPNVPHLKLPDGAIVNAFVSIVQYLDPEDGAMRFGTYAWGDVPISQMAGLCEVGKITLWNNWRASQES